MNVIEAVKELNTFKDDWTVIDSIDRPIRQLILEMHRIGLQTIFSCCGYSYPDEEEPKTHAKESFVLFYDPIIHPQTVQNFFSFVTIATRCGWKIMRYHNNQWRISFDQNSEQQEFYEKLEDGNSIHDFELKAIAIFHLAKACKEIPTVKESFTIIDGNNQYKKYPELDWHIKPKKDTIVYLDRGKSSDTIIPDAQTTAE